MATVEGGEILMTYRRPVPRKDQASKADKRSDADAMVAAFAKGGAIRNADRRGDLVRLQDMRPYRHHRHGAGQKARCPKCREPL
jgi:hypothetical protein